MERGIVLHLLARFEGIEATATFGLAQLLFPEQAGQRAVGNLDIVLVFEHFTDAHPVTLAAPVQCRQYFHENRVWGRCP